MSQPSNLPDAMERIRDERLREALAEIKRALVERIGSAFRLILFGSRARGDAEPDSDVDLMVILPDEACTVATRETVRSTVYDFALEYDYVFSVIVVSESIAAEHAGFMVFGAVEREGSAALNRENEVRRLNRPCRGSSPRNPPRPTGLRPWLETFRAARHGRHGTQPWG